uniref:Plexin-A4 n=1 Tax=Cacopsylla melanoneura TaxID=428564 RepID=A0A8D8PT46_9HEMI
MCWSVFIILLVGLITAEDWPAPLKSTTGNHHIIVTPDEIKRVCGDYLEINIDSSSTLPHKICCNFIINNQTISYIGYKSESIQCLITPALNDNNCFPPIPAGQHSISTTLSVSPRTNFSCTQERKLTYGNDILTTNFTFFDCTTYISCTQCLSSEFPCDWSENNLCDHTNKNVADRQHNLTQCDKYPSIIGSTEIPVLSNSWESVNVTFNNHPFIRQFDKTIFFCYFNIENVIKNVTATLIDDNTISCNATGFNYSSNVSHINASFTISWRGYKWNTILSRNDYLHTLELENPNNVHLVIYKLPTITSVMSDSQCPKGTSAGGTNINVFGNNLDNVKKPKIYVLYKQKRYKRTCKVKNSGHMKCEAPTINVTVENLDIKYPEELEYGFEMDPFPGFHNMSRNLRRSFKELTCQPPEQLPNSLNDNQEVTTADLQVVTVVVANTKFNDPQPGILTEKALYGGIAMIIFLVLISIAHLIGYRCKPTEKSLVYKSLEQMQKEIELTEQRVAAACKEAFVELQTNVTDFARDLTTDCVPFLDYRTYAMRTLFPKNEQHRILRFERPEVLFKEKELGFFQKLIMDKTFLLLFIRTLESNSNFSMSDRAHVASLLMIVLRRNMKYCTDILTTLLAELIEKCMQRKSNPKLLLRRTESIAEKMVSYWFTFFLYNFLRENVGEPLYNLFRAIKYQVEKGPVDAITGEARYALSEDKLIRNVIDYKPMTVAVSIGRYDKIPVHVLSCDTISQVKEKSLDTIYRTTPFSQRPIGKENLGVEWKTGNAKKLILYDFDTKIIEGELERMNTLNHYNVPDGAHLTLVPIECKSCTLDVMEMKKVMTKKWHLVRQDDNADRKKGERSHKLVSEIFLTRLLTTKEILQKFVDDLFKAIFTLGDHGSAVPLAVKNMFDFLDKQELEHDITDAEVVHTWKSNALPLRFWVNLIKNPDFLFDIHKSNTVDSCLSVVAQAFMDSCGTSDLRLSKDSPSSKLIYAKDIPVYKELVAKYYSSIKSKKIPEDQMNAMLGEEFELHRRQYVPSEVNYLYWALYELYNYALEYNEPLTLALEKDQDSRKQKLAHKLNQVRYR